MEVTQASTDELLKKSEKLIEKAYTDFHQPVLSYIIFKTDNYFLAEDICQDVFLRLLDHKLMLREETLKSFTFTIAHNIVIDFLRRNARRKEVDAYMYEVITGCIDSTEHLINTREIGNMELKKLDSFSPQRKLVYTLSRFNEMPIQDISHMLGISKRTVEAHLFSTRKEMREFIRNCI